MKFKILSIVLVSTIAALLMSGTVTGCKTPPGRVAYNVAGATQTSVEVVMGAWNEYVGLKHPSLDDELKVKAAYEKYQVAMVAVCDAGAIYAASTVTNRAGDTGLQAAMTQARLNAAQSLADLTALVRSFGIQF